MSYKEIIEYHLAKAVSEGIVPTDAWRLWKSEGVIANTTAEILIKNTQNIKSKPCTNCGKEVQRNKDTFLGVQRTRSDIPYELDLHNCPSCHSTIAFRRDKEEAIK